MIAAQPTNADILAAVDSIRFDFHELKSDLHELNRRMGTVESRLGLIEETLTPLSKAFDIDSERIVDHEQRISALELKAV